jgi:hypothetical protein
MDLSRSPISQTGAQVFRGAGRSSLFLSRQLRRFLRLLPAQVESGFPSAGFFRRAICPLIMGADDAEIVRFQEHFERRNGRTSPRAPAQMLHAMG